MPPTSRAHKHLQELMALLDQALPGDTHRALRTTLRDRGTAACALARLGNEQEMLPDLTAMQDAASQIDPEAEKGSALADVRRLIDATLEELRGH